MLEKLNHSHWKLYAAVWMIALYSGALLNQFVIKDAQMSLAIWGLLFAGAVVVTTACINWTSTGDENTHLLILGFLMVSFGLGLVVTIYPPSFLPEIIYDFLKIWSICAIFLYSFIFYKTRNLNATFSLLLIIAATGLMIFLPDVRVPLVGALGELMPLLFGFVQSVAILILLI